MTLIQRRGKYYKIVNNQKSEVSKEEFFKLQEAESQGFKYGEEKDFSYETKERSTNNEAWSEGVQQTEENSEPSEEISRGFSKSW